MNRRAKKRILLADDDAGLRRLVSITLGDTDFDLLQAADGQETLRVAREQHPDLILLDINMPRLDGLSVCRALKSDVATRDIRVVMLTASGSEADRDSGHLAGADDYFVKPFSPVELLNKVYEMLGE